MCDNCGILFSVNQQGWHEYTRQVRNDDDHPYNHGMQTMNMCKECAGGPSDTLTPRIEIENIAASKRKTEGF
jgi:hypothetical protein